MIFTLVTISNGTLIILTLWGAALTEICRTLNHRLRGLMRAIETGFQPENELDEVTDHFHRYSPRETIDINRETQA